MTMIAQRQFATLPAALRPFQKYHGALAPEMLRLATDDHAIEMLSRAESDEFCEKLNAIDEEIKLAVEKTPQVSPGRGTEGRCKG